MFLNLLAIYAGLYGTIIKKTLSLFLSRTLNCQDFESNRCPQVILSLLWPFKYIAGAPFMHDDLLLQSDRVVMNLKWANSIKSVYEMYQTSFICWVLLAKDGFRCETVYQKLCSFPTNSIFAWWISYYALFCYHLSLVRVGPMCINRHWFFFFSILLHSIVAHIWADVIANALQEIRVHLESPKEVFMIMPNNGTLFQLYFQSCGIQHVYAFLYWSNSNRNKCSLGGRGGNAGCTQ